MKTIRAVYLKSRIFYGLAMVCLLYCLAFVWPALMFLATFLLVALFAVSFYDSAILTLSAGKISGNRKVPKNFSLSDQNNVVLFVANGSSRNLNFRIIDEIPAQFQVRDFEINQLLVAGDRDQLRYQIKPLSRGEYHFGYLNVYISSKLGIVEYRKTFELNQMVKVYPSFIQMKLFELMVFSADNSNLGIRKTRRIGHGYEYSDIREYVTGDDTRALNWKASSRTGKLMVNNFDDEKAQQVYAIINKSRVMRTLSDGQSLMDYAINTSLAILNIALKSQDHVGLLTFAKNVETFIPVGKRGNQMQLIQNALYNQKESEDEENYLGLLQFTRLKIKRRSLMLLFTNFMSLNSLQRCMPEIKKINRHHLLVIIFFENTELESYKQEPVRDTMDICSKVMADKLSEELSQVVYELRNAGVQAIKSKPEELSTNTINKYLELKSIGMI